MAHTIWNPADRQSILDRFERLSPGARPKWDSLDALERNPVDWTSEFEVCLDRGVEFVTRVP